MTEEEFQIPYAIEAHVTPVAPELTPAGPEFTRIRCGACRREVTVPTAQLPLVPGLPARDDDGVRLALCAKCAFGDEANPVSDRPMWHVRLLRDDGTVLAEDDIATFIDVSEVAKAHGDVTDAELARGHTVILELSDPDGLCEPMAIMIEPRSWN